MDANFTGADVFFILLGAILVFAMHGGFAFLEVGTVRHKNQVNALVKILMDFSLSTIAYFFIGYFVAYGTTFLVSAAVLTGDGNTFEPQGLTLVKFFFLATFAAAIPAIISGGVAERLRFTPLCISTIVIVAVAYPFFEGIVWNGNFGIQDMLEGIFGAPFHDFAGSVVVHAVGGWMALAAILMLGSRIGRYTEDGRLKAFFPSSIPWLALGSWLLCVGWFGFNVMTALSLESVSGLVAMNSLMSMVGGVVLAGIFSRNDPGYIHNGALAGLVAVCAGSDVMHPVGSLIVGSVAGAIFVITFELCQKRLRVDDALGVWPLHGICGAWGAIAAGIFGQEFFGGLGGVSFGAQIVGTLAGVIYAFFISLLIFKAIKLFVAIRLTPDEERMGADVSIHKISSTSERD